MNAVNSENLNHYFTKGILLFTVEEETKFTRRYEDGYDLTDPCYKAQLEIKHPRVTGNIEAMVKYQSLSDVTLGNAQPNFCSIF